MNTLRDIRACLVMAFAFGSVTPLWAGSYTVQYTGGTVAVHIVDPVTGKVTDTSSNYMLKKLEYGGAFAMVNAQGSVTCSGMITATFKWVPSGHEPPPTSIIIKEHCVVATYQNSGTMYTGLATSPEGYRFTNKTNPGGSFTVTCAPYAFSQGTTAASASVYYDAAAIAAPQVTVSPKTNGLSWDDTNRRQLASYSCTVTWSGLTGNGWQLAGVSWSTGGTGLHGTPGTLHMGNAAGSDLHSATCQGSAYGPGTFNSADCTLSMTAPDGTALNVVANADDCAALGGVIAFSVQAGSIATWYWDSDDPTQPWYLQFFYTHNAVPTSGTAQKQQLGTVSAPGQPAGTQVVWTVPSFLYTPGLSNGTVTTTGGDTPLVLTADSAGTGAVTCQFNGTWIDPMNPDHAAYVLSVADDTATSKQLVNGAWVAMVNQFHAHTPATVTCPPTVGYEPSYPAGGCGWERDYAITLFDSGGTGMQDVWVNERWNPQPDPSIGRNTSATPWTTQEKPLGQFNVVDHIWYVWVPPQPWSGWTVQHYYWAASTAVAPGSTEGILVGTFTTHWTPGDPNNSPNPADCGQQ